MSNILQNELDQLLSGNQIYIDRQPDWIYFLESFLGGSRYKNAGHLTRYELESDKEYAARLNQTHLTNHCKSIVDVYNSFLFRQHPYREMGNLDGLRETTEFMEDADFDGRSFNN